MDQIIQTDKSFLNVHQYTLDEKCIKDVSDKLLENPEQKYMAKDVINIGQSVSFQMNLQDINIQGNL